MDSFQLFSDARFPPEVRDLIWEEAISSHPPRNVELRCGHKETICTPDNEIISVKYKFVSSAPIPALLHACSRSRELAQKRWTLTFDSKYRFFNGDEKHFPDLAQKRIPRTWFDFKSDILVFLEYASNHDDNITTVHVMQEIELRMRERVEIVAVNSPNTIHGDDPDDYLEWDFQYVYAISMGFPSARTILVSDHPEEGGGVYDLTHPDSFVRHPPNSTYEKGVVQVFAIEFDHLPGRDARGRDAPEIAFVHWPLRVLEVESDDDLEYEYHGREIL